MRETRKLLLIIGTTAVLVIIACVIAFSIALYKEVNVEQTDLVQPTETHLILHLSTYTLPYGKQPTPCSYFLFYDEDGEVIKKHKVDEEVVGDFVVQTDLADYFFFKNQTTVVTSDAQQVLDGKSDVVITSVNFGPSQIGYIDDLDVSYALFNVGSRGGEYINLLRFASTEKVYDVILPIYLEHICYDDVHKRFYCIISPVNMGHDSSAVSYVTVSYNEEDAAFSTDGEIHRIQDSTYSFETTLYRYSMVKNNLLIMAILNASGEQNSGDLLLNLYDMKNNMLVESKYLLENYDLGQLGHGLMSGSSAFPMCVRGGALYIFSSTQQFFVIKDENNILVEEMPFSFKDTYSVFSPEDKLDEQRNNFFGSRVQVQEDGTIYILNLYKHNQVIIYRWDKGKYEQVCEFHIPDDLPESLIINSFYFCD